MSLPTAEELFYKLYDYAVDVSTGKQVAGKKHIHAANRFLSDIQKAQDDPEGFAYYFDIEELEQFNRWASLFKHTKGVLANKNIELTPFQLFLAANIFCWKKKSDDKRRYRKAYVQLGRKNTKSQMLAIISSYVTFLSNQTEETYISGWTSEQSKIVYDEILAQIRRVTFLKDKYSDSYHRIRHLKTNSVIRALSKEARKQGEGLNPSLAILDEYHTHLTSEIMEALESGMGARDEPLVVIITTAGLDLNVPCKEEYDYCSNIIDPDNPVENERYFVLICEIDEGDDPFDESVWIKANPVAATYPQGIENIRDLALIARDKPSAMDSFLTKQCNIWVQSSEKGYLDQQKWASCLWKAPIELKGQKVYLGLDLATKHDLCSLGIVIPLENGRFFVDSHSFIPNESLEQRIKSDRAPFKQWIREGLLTTTDGAVTDYSYIIDHIEMLVRDKLWDVVENGYDPFDATYLSQEMSQMGYTMVEVKQNIATQHEPLTEFREKVLKREIEHNGNGLLSWAVGNAITVENTDARIKLSKSKSTERIDPLASIINAYSRAMYHEFKPNVERYIMSDDFGF
ncbi:terminase large subunit [Alkalihalobacillus sp. LMS6]|uniref:terminase large subunit n=1 Tax=Alkalihalobacillus sp. LMS6 TaxID=2924034 RepID=UPI0020D1DE6A|nr:terminase TerL endonuclease subunit [Alkalihalobacillus sp. LMS6]UTR05460.1 terminase large subunit [Alkalihalobacillus sp. LMS6]